MIEFQSPSSNDRRIGSPRGLSDRSKSGHTVVLVVGLYKSGTSLTAQMISALGFKNLPDLWEDFVEGTSHTYLTYESKTVNDLNDQIIKAFLGSLDRLPSRITFEILNKYYSLTRRFNRMIFNLVIPQLNGGLVIKDPRFCLTLPLWSAVLDKLANIKIVWIIRDRALVVRSWLRDDWCRATLRLHTEKDAYVLAASYESYLLRQYAAHSSRYQNLVLNLEAVRNDPKSSVTVLAEFLNRQANATELAKIIKPNRVPPMISVMKI
ncbi:MAG: sulfotransferase domain-containing protein [bacterium]